VSAFAAGWGDTDPLGRRSASRRFPTTLRQTTFPLHSDAACSSSVGGGYGTSFERATNICGGILQTGRMLGSDTCQGDSGGPLTVDVAGVRKLAGITSWGEGCAERQFGAYSRIDALRSWVDSVPGATDGDAASGGPGGTQAVTSLRRTAADYTRLTLSWNAPTSGTPPERYAVWRRLLADGERAEELIGITTRRTFVVPVNASRRANAYTWNVRPLDLLGSNGPSAALVAGPRPDVTRPAATGRISLLRRSRTSLVIRWGAAVDRQSGIESYVIQRRLPGRAFTTVDGVDALPRAATIDTLPRGSSIQVRIGARDRAGNQGPWSPIATFATLS